MERTAPTPGVTESRTYYDESGNLVESVVFTPEEPRIEDDGRRTIVRLDIWMTPPHGARAHAVSLLVRDAG